MGSEQRLSSYFCVYVVEGWEQGVYHHFGMDLLCLSTCIFFLILLLSTLREYMCGNREVKTKAAKKKPAKAKPEGDTGKASDGLSRAQRKARYFPQSLNV